MKSNHDLGWCAHPDGRKQQIQENKKFHCERPRIGQLHGNSHEWGCVVSTYIISSRSSVRCRKWHGLKKLIKKLQGSIELNFNPTRSVLDGGPGIVQSPPLHKTQPQNAQPPQIVRSDAGSGRQTCNDSMMWSLNSVSGKTWFSLMAGTKEPMLLGPWKFPETAAAWAAAAVCACATSCCIWSWHWFKSNTYDNSRTLLFGNKLEIECKQIQKKMNRKQACAFIKARLDKKLVPSNLKNKFSSTKVKLG